MKFNILMDLKSGPWGGGNQFLKALRQEAKRSNTYTDSIQDADVILFNSHHNPKQVLKLQEQYQEHLFVHRVDGPMSYRGKSGLRLDQRIFYLNSLVADGTVFQSEWSRSQTIKEKLIFSNSNIVIINAPDPEIFYAKDKKNSYFQKRKVKLIASSWSSNKMKGIDVFSFLDNNLDFNDYSMSFAGNIDRSFKNISLLGQLDSSHLADQLRRHDIFIFASEREACSNSLLEALHSGLPVVCRNSSSNPEILGEGGILFEDSTDLLEKIDILRRDHQKYKENIKVKKIADIHNDYINFFSSLKVNDQKKKLNFKEKLKFKLGLI